MKNFAKKRPHHRATRVSAGYLGRVVEVAAGDLGYGTEVNAGGQGHGTEGGRLVTETGVYLFMLYTIIFKSVNLRHLRYCFKV